MFIGHWAPAFAAAAASKKAPGLGTLFIAGQLVDYGFFTLAIVGIEKFRIEPGATTMNPLDLYWMPYTHSLVGALAWAAAFALFLLLIRQQLATALIGGAVVFSHWLLDLLVHRPDLTIAGSPPMLGLGLWNYPAIEMPLEIGITLAALLWYIARTKGPLMPPWILFALLIALQSINWFGPQPEAAGIGMSLMALAGYAIAGLTASWVGTTRRHVSDRGLAGARPRR